MKTATAPSYPVSIFIAGEYYRAKQICQEYCDAVGLCVTVTSTSYIYTDGEQMGVIVGLINYPRFPAEPADILHKANQLAAELMDRLQQQSYSIQTLETTHWYSRRPA
jgi:hypothetical protein